MPHKKERPSTYEKPLKVDMTFDELLELVVSVDPREEQKMEEDRAKRKKKAVQHRAVTRAKKK